MEKNKLGKSIFSSQLARKLIREGYKIIDIKPQKANPDRTVFIFQYSDSLKQAIEDYKSVI